MLLDAWQTENYLKKLTDAQTQIKELVPDSSEPVRHGHWIRKGLLWHCSACSCGAFKSDFVFGARYCPTCGAKMDERKEE